MRALHSSSALAANLFDYWTERDKSPLLAALGVDAKGETSLDFEARFPTGLGGTPPHLDVAMRRSTGSVVAVEAKFEALHRVMDSFHRAGNYPRGMDLPMPRGDSWLADPAMLCPLVPRP